MYATETWRESRRSGPGHPSMLQFENRGYQR